MFYRDCCYIYLEARAGISNREDFHILESQEQILTLYKIPLKVSVLGFILNIFAGL